MTLQGLFLSKSIEAGAGFIIIIIKIDFWIYCIILINFINFKVKNYVNSVTLNFIKLKFDLEIFFLKIKFKI